MQDVRSVRSQHDAFERGSSHGGWMTSTTTGGDTMVEQQKKKKEAKKRDKELAEREAKCCCFSIRYVTMFVALSVLAFYLMTSTGNVAAIPNVLTRMEHDRLNHQLWQQGQVVGGRLSTTVARQRALATQLGVQMSTANLTTTLAAQAYLDTTFVTGSAHEGRHSKNQNFSLTGALQDATGNWISSNSSSSSSGVTPMVNSPISARNVGGGLDILSSTSFVGQSFVQGVVSVQASWQAYFSNFASSPFRLVLWNQTSQRIITTNSVQESQRYQTCFSSSTTDSPTTDECLGVPSAYTDAATAFLVDDLKTKFKTRLPAKQESGQALKIGHPYTGQHPLLATRLDSGFVSGEHFHCLSSALLTLPEEGGEERRFKMLRVPLPIFSPSVLAAKNINAAITVLEDQAIALGGASSPSYDVIGDTFEVYLFVIGSEFYWTFWNVDIITVLAFSLLGLLILIELCVAAQLTMINPLRWIIDTSSEVENLDFTCLATCDAVIANQKNLTLRELYQTFTNLVCRIESLSVYLSKEVVRDLANLGTLSGMAKNNNGNGNGGTGFMEHKMLTVMVVDIAKFTSICEALPLNIFLEFIEQYFEVSSRVLLLHGCTIDKYVGDATFGFWGAPLEFEDQGFSACATALHLKTMVNRLRGEWIKLGHDLQVRIGVHQGPTLVGSIGSTERLVYTALGSTVNMANALEETGKKHSGERGSTILISGHVLRDAQKLYRKLFITRLVGCVSRSGKTIDALELVGVSREGLIKAGFNLAETAIAHKKLQDEFGWVAPPECDPEADGGSPLNSSAQLVTEQAAQDEDAQIAFEEADERARSTRGFSPRPQGSPLSPHAFPVHPVIDAENQEGQSHEKKTKHSKKLQQITQLEELQSIDMSFWLSADEIMVCEKLTHAVQVSRGDQKRAPNTTMDGEGAASPSAEPEGLLPAGQMLEQLLKSEVSVLRSIGVSIPTLRKMAEQWKRGKPYS